MTIFNVSDAAGLYEALANATGGDNIKLAGGDYGEIDLGQWTGHEADFDSPVTIVSENLNDPAVFSGLELQNVSNLTFDGITFDYEFQAGDPSWTQKFVVNGSSDVTIKNSVFDGDIASGTGTALDGYGYGAGLVINGSTGLVIKNNEFDTWGGALNVRESSDVKIIGNDVHGIRADGFAFAEVQSLLIQGNHIHDFKTAPGSGDHQDMIQFLTYGTDAPSSDVIIRANILDANEGDYTQSIFIGNELVNGGVAGPEMYYQNFLIEENVIRNGHLHGISVGETNGLVVQNNTLLSITDPHSAPVINLGSDSTNVQVTQNAVVAILGHTDQADWQVSNNAHVQNTDPGLPGYYSDLFLESSMHGEDGVWSYIVTPGSLLEDLAVGAPMLFLDTAPASVTPLFDVTSNPETSQSLVFDATSTFGPDGQVAPEGATFIWDFGDGTTATGQVVEHVYGIAGNYDVTLTVKLDGEGPASASTTQAPIGIMGDDIISFNADDGQFYLQGYGVETVVGNSGEASVVAGAGMAVDLGGPGAKVEFSKDVLERFFGSEAFEMSMTVKADQPGTSWGEIARIHPSVVVGVQEDGNLSVWLSTDSGEQVHLVTNGISVNDGAAHDISVAFDGASNSLQVLLDGVVSGSETISGSMPSMSSWGLVFGEPWGGQNFDGKLSAFELDAVSTDYPAFTGELEGGGHDEGSLPTLDDFVVDFAELEETQLEGDAVVKTTEDGEIVRLDGEEDFVRLGKLEQFEDTKQVSLSVSWNKTSLDTDNQRLAWNNQNIGVSVKGDGLKIYLGQKEDDFSDTINIKNLGLNDKEDHEVTLIVDAKSDHLQVILDGELILDEQDLDITFSGGIDNGWKIGGGNRHYLDGKIHDFRVEEDAEFLADTYVARDDASLMG